MYISVRDRPAGGTTRGSSSTRPPVGRVVITLGIVSLLTDVSSESVSAILPLYLTAVVGLTPVAYGFIDGLYQGVSALVRLGGGWLADASDRPKWVAFLGYGLSAVARVLPAVRLGRGRHRRRGHRRPDRQGHPDGAPRRHDQRRHARRAPRPCLRRAPDARHHRRGARAARSRSASCWCVPDGYSVVLVVSLAFALAGVALLGLLGPDVRARRDRERSSGPTPPPFRWRDLTDPRLRPLLRSRACWAC